MDKPTEELTQFDGDNKDKEQQEQMPETPASPPSSPDSGALDALSGLLGESSASDPTADLFAMLDNSALGTGPSTDSALDPLSGLLGDLGSPSPGTQASTNNVPGGATLEMASLSPSLSATPETATPTGTEGFTAGTNTPPAEAVPVVPEAPTPPFDVPPLEASSTPEASPAQETADSALDLPPQEAPPAPEAAQPSAPNTPMTAAPETLPNGGTEEFTNLPKAPLAGGLLHMGAMPSSDGATTAEQGSNPSTVVAPEDDENLTLHPPSDGGETAEHPPAPFGLTPPPASSQAAAFTSGFGEAFGASHASMSPTSPSDEAGESSATDLEPMVSPTKTEAFGPEVVAHLQQKMEESAAAKSSAEAMPSSAAEAPVSNKQTLMFGQEELNAYLDSQAKGQTAAVYTVGDENIAAPITTPTISTADDAETTDTEVSTATETKAPAEQKAKAPAQTLMFGQAELEAHLAASKQQSAVKTSPTEALTAAGTDPLTSAVSSDVSVSLNPMNDTAFELDVQISGNMEAAPPIASTSSTPNAEAAKTLMFGQEAIEAQVAALQAEAARNPVLQQPATKATIVDNRRLTDRLMGSQDFLMESVLVQEGDEIPDLPAEDSGELPYKVETQGLDQAPVPGASNVLSVKRGDAARVEAAKAQAPTDDPNASTLIMSQSSLPAAAHQAPKSIRTGPPAQKGKTAMVVILIVGILLALVGILGFVWPGFFV